jgi:hypothetical protein
LSRIRPSEAVLAINDLFGQRQEIYSHAITPQQRTEVGALLSVLDQIPGELIELDRRDYLEYIRCRSALSSALARWSAGDSQPVRDVGQKDPIERIRRLLMQCRDELPPAQPEISFVTDPTARTAIEERLQAAWTDFNAQEWMGATVFAGIALEALLLWALKQLPLADEETKNQLDKVPLAELIDKAFKADLIGSDARDQARLAKDVRNLVHAGRAIRTATNCSKATALTALAGVYRVVADLCSRSSN